MREIIFADGEFPGLYPDGTEFLSLALIKENGDELYFEMNTHGVINDWTKENILPYLNGNKISRDQAKQRIIDFVGDNKPYFLSYVNSFDWMGICGLFGVFEVPFFWIPLDFATMLYQSGIDPETKPEELALKYDIPLDNHKPHNALDDARLIRELYFKMFTK
ncbi:MAG: 3'-5' exoribonuclease [Candidatus Gracilibacteria bacterium]|nr:3'-5' exoribonuclease [Candidatus Gracilibacteria bacterium]